jgi:hypothetical protein
MVRRVRRYRYRAIVHDSSMKPFPAARARALRNLARSACYQTLATNANTEFVEEQRIPLRDGEILHGIYEPPVGTSTTRWALTEHTLYVQREGDWEVVPLVDVDDVTGVGFTVVPKWEISQLALRLRSGEGFVLRFEGCGNDLWTVWTYLARLADLDHRDPG